MTNRNAESYFTNEPNINIERSIFTRDFETKSTYSTGLLYPFLVDLDILPAMTIKNQTTIVARLLSPLVATMDIAYYDIYYFFVPYRQLWDNWKRFNGENELGAWAQTVEYEVPCFLTDDTHKFKRKGFHDHAGLRPEKKIQPIQKFARRAYVRIWNYFFRNQNIEAPVEMYTTDGDSLIDPETNDNLLPVNKFRDYFTSGLPQPQKGSPVTIPLGTTAEVIGTGEKLGIMDVTTQTELPNTYLTWYTSSDGSYRPIGTRGTSVANNKLGISKEKSGLIADLTTATAASINALRLAFATQRVLEKDARYGTRYHEMLAGHFGVTNPDARMQIPEYLGGKRFALNMIEQTSTVESANAPLGFPGATSNTVNINVDFTKSFTEHGALMGLICIRTNQSYQYGTARQWTRRKRLDYYYPSLAHISNQPVYNYEIWDDQSEDSNGVFNYKEAWAEYRHKLNTITGELRSDFSSTVGGEKVNSLDYWHYAERMDSLPVFSQEWATQKNEEMARTLEVTNHDQIVADINIKQKVAMPMPFHSYPGLIDHF